MNIEYRFKAVSTAGKKVIGTLTAKSKQEALIILESRQLYPIALHEDRISQFFKKVIPSVLLCIPGLKLYNSRDLMLFCRQLATMLAAGIPLLRALNILAGQFEKGALRRQLADIALLIEGGSSFAEALEAKPDFFPPMMSGMVEAGEKGGILDQAMNRLADHYEKQHDLEEKIRSATAYPLLICTVAFVVVLIMIVFVLPQFSNIFNQMGLEMPFFSRLLMNAGKWTAGNWPLLLAIFFFLSGSATIALQTDKGRLAADKLHFCIPLYSKIYRQIIAARFARTMGTMVASGLSLHQSIVLADKVIGNKAVSLSLQSLHNALSRGEDMTNSLQNNDYFPLMLAEMVKIGEETGKLDFALEKTAIYYEREVAYAVDRLSSVLEPVLLIGVGLFVGALIFSVLSPMYQIFQLI